MPIFGTTDSDSPQSVDVPPFLVYVAHINVKGDSPTWNNFALESRVKVIEMFCGSSVVGASYATLQMVPAPPSPIGAGDALDVQGGGSIMLPGDRVKIGMKDDPAGDDSTIRWFFCGYCIRPSLSIGGESETATWRIAGPEWVWGEHAGSGSSSTVTSQGRRHPSADDAFITDQTTTTAYADWDLCPALPIIFNPNGRKNMSITDAVISDGSSPINGRIFDEPDRRVAGVEFTAHWTIVQAVKYLACTYDVAYSGIAMPSWGSIAIDTASVLRSVDVDGLGVWGALEKVCGAKYAFFVEPWPTGSVALQSWGPFQLNFFNRTASLGGEADLYIAPRLSDPTAVSACVTRLQAAMDCSKTVNSYTLVGTYLRHICLRYHGYLTLDGLSDDQKPLSLQHGWTKGDGNILDYAGTGTGNMNGWIDIDSRGRLDDWKDNFCTYGKNFAANRHVFRLFVWNEAAEYANASGDAASKMPEYTYAVTDEAPVTGSAETWTRPDLAGLLGSVYARRRRPFHDTMYQDVLPDSYRRIRPVLFIAYNTASDPSASETLTAWKKVPEGAYQVDRARGAVWITVQDLSAWQPFFPSGMQNPITFGDLDDTSFATLLARGRLRLALECCIEAEGLVVNSPWESTTGNPLSREAIERTGDKYLKIDMYDDGQGFILSLPAPSVDETVDAQTRSDDQRAAGRDTQIHAGITVAADWPRQAIGLFINTITGRNIDLSTGTDRGSQIVALTMDPIGMCWQLLTESAAMQLKGDLRRTKAAARDRIIRDWSVRDPSAGGGWTSVDQEEVH